MSRHPTAEVLSAYLDGECGERERRDVEEHLRSCSRCSDHLDQLRQVVGGLRALDPVAPPRRLGVELQSRLLREMPPFEKRSRRGRGLPGILFQPAILAAVGVVLALAVIVLLFLQALQRTPSESEAVDTSAVHQQAELVIIGERQFRPSRGGWTQAGLSRGEIDAAELVEWPELEGRNAFDPALQPLLEGLDGEVTLRLDDGRVVTIVPRRRGD